MAKLLGRRMAVEAACVCTNVEFPVATISRDQASWWCNRQHG
ncbi:MAG: hypothetical protein OEN22_09440 [Gammaproteobacteria bacterium]|nr:hypothetical protein [Gammaproteobacteria bacterium]